MPKTVQVPVAATTVEVPLDTKVKVFAPVTVIT